MALSLEAGVQAALRDAFAAAGVQVDEVPLRKVPNAAGWGFATQLALKHGGKGAQQLAETVASIADASPLFERTEAVRGFVNVYVGVSSAAQQVMDAVLTEGDRYGAGEQKTDHYMVEYSCPNTHKEFHVGHLRTTAFGDAVARLLRFSGYPVETDTYIGDIGAHVLRCLWCLTKYHEGEEPPADRLDWLGKIYSEAVRRIEEEAGAKDEIAEMFHLWERGDIQLLQLWRETKQWSLDELERIYRQLDVHFDHWFFESEVEAEGNRIAQELIDRSIAEYSDGLPIVRLDNLGVLPIRRSDGTSLYQTKELALSMRKFREFGIDKSIVVSDVSQTLYFKQVYKVLELYGFEHAGDLVHLSYERVNLPEGKMSSRLGNIVTYEDIAEDAIERVNAIVAEKNPALPLDERHAVAEQVAISALKFAMLSVSNTSVITFDWERVLDFDGYAGPYIQYAYVRANRILQRATESGLSRDGAAAPPEVQPVERQLLETMADFPNQIARATDQRSPVIVATYIFELAKQFSDFYQALRVLQEPDPAVRAFRLRLTECVKQVLGNGLAVLGLARPESM
ncbi:MAG: arginine--tRNA ligase [Chloroflexi bacterium]|nr:arginine--tRNA ligase [Chloroflexota bacterium]